MRGSRDASRQQPEPRRRSRAPHPATCASLPVRLFRQDPQCDRAARAARAFRIAAASRHRRAAVARTADQPADDSQHRGHPRKGERQALVGRWLDSQQWRGAGHLPDGRMGQDGLRPSSGLRLLAISPRRVHQAGCA